MYSEIKSRTSSSSFLWLLKELVMGTSFIALPIFGLFAGIEYLTFSDSLMDAGWSYLLMAIGDGREFFMESWISSYLTMGNIRFMQGSFENALESIALIVKFILPTYYVRLCFAYLERKLNHQSTSWSQIIEKSFDRTFLMLLAFTVLLFAVQFLHSTMFFGLSSSYSTSSKVIFMFIYFLLLVLLYRLVMVDAYLAYERNGVWQSIQKSWKKIRYGQAILITFVLNLFIAICALIPVIIPMLLTNPEMEIRNTFSAVGLGIAYILILQVGVAYTSMLYLKRDRENVFEENEAQDKESEHLVLNIK